MKADNSFCVAFFVGTFIGTLVAALFWLALLVLMTSPAHAHGDAEWIMNRGYVDNWGAHCCGPADCEVAKPGELQHIPGGWLHVPTQTTIPEDRPGVYPSIDVQLWRCVRGGQLKCVFPGAGL